MNHFVCHAFQMDLAKVSASIINKVYMTLCRISQDTHFYTNVNSYAPYMHMHEIKEGLGLFLYALA